MSIYHGPIQRFINGVTAGFKASKGFIAPKRDDAYDLGYKLGLKNQKNDDFLKNFLRFWTDYASFMSGDDIVDQPCDDIDKHEGNEVD